MMKRVRTGYFYREHPTDDMGQGCEGWKEDVPNMASEQRTELRAS